jgi:hypothetical protein
MGYCLIKQQPESRRSWRVSFAAGVLRVSSKLGSSHRTLTTPVEAYAPPCTVDILPFSRRLWRRSARWLRQLVSTLRPASPGSARQHARAFAGPRLSASQLLLSGTCPVAHEVPLPAAVGFYALGEAAGRLAAMLTSRRAERGGGLTSEGTSRSVLTRAICEANRSSGGGVLSWRVRSRGLPSFWRFRVACRTGACGLRRRSGA